MEGLCHYGAKCAYKHKRMSNSQNDYKDTVSKDLKKLWEENDDLKKNNSNSNRDPEESLKKSMEEIKAEIKNLGCFKQIYQRTNRSS